MPRRQGDRPLVARLSFAPIWPDNAHMRSLGVLVCGLFLVACDDGDETGSTGAEPSVTVLYGAPEATALDLFPSNRYTKADAESATGLRVVLGSENTKDQLATAYPTTLAELNELDGFSTTGGIAARFSGPIDPRGLVSLPNADPPVLDPVRDATEYTASDTPLFLVDVDPASPERGKAVGIVPRYYEQFADVDFPEDDFTLLAEPATPLRPGTRYVFAVTDELVAKDGTRVGRNAAMSRALGTSKVAYDEALRAGVAEAAQAIGTTPAHVVAATSFTTASVETGIVAAGKARRAAPAPALAQAFSVETKPTSPDRRARFHAAFSAPEFRKNKPDGKWQIGDDGAPVVQKNVELELFLAFSDSTQSGPRPVVIFQHGLGGNKDGNWGTSERLAAVDPKGVAVFAIDSPEHGSRGNGDDSVVSSAFSFFGVEPGSLEFDIGRARDNFRQMAVDQLELVRFITTLGTLDLLPLDASGNPAPDGVPDLDVSRVLYIGHSFGSVQGATVFALAPEITQATWNVGGAGLMMLLRDSPLFSLGVVKSLTPPGTPFGSVARFMAFTQAIVDPGDPLNFARHAALEPLPGVAGWKPRDVLIQEVANDSIVPNSTSEALGRAAGASLLHRVGAASGFSEAKAPVSQNQGEATAVICQFDKMEGDKPAEHGSLIFAPEAIAQYVEFFSTGVKNGHGSVNAPYP